MEWTPEFQTTFLTVKKTLFYEFFPSKAAEDECKQTGIPYQPTKRLTEIRDVYAPTTLTEWGFNNFLSVEEVQRGAIFVSHHVAFEHVFRQWSKEDTERVVFGNGLGTVQTIWDITNPVCSFMYRSDQTRFYQRADGHYELGCAELIVYRSLRPLDRFALTYDAESSAFYLQWFGPYMGI